MVRSDSKTVFNLCFKMINSIGSARPIAAIANLLGLPQSFVPFRESIRLDVAPNGTVGFST